MDGFFIVDKPKGITSLGVCNQIKRKFQLNKCGHSGTLDPNTTGVLVVACNQATKLLKLINEHDKEYIATIIFGYDSDTLDMDGKIKEDKKMTFQKEDLFKALEQLGQKEEQIPPMTSAIKVNGRKLYEYQRKGIELTVSPRKVKIYEYELLSDLENKEGHIEVCIRLKVSKGFYVRSFARDLGILLGGCAILKELKRTEAGAFSISQAVSLEKIEEKNLLSIEEVFQFPKVEVNDYLAKLVQNGVMLDERQTSVKGVFYVTNKCDIIAIYEEVGTLKYKPILIFK